MECGISTACFYPLDTLESLSHVINAGARVTEIFLNTFSELEDAFIAKLLDRVNDAGIRVSALHPFTSAMEGFLFVSDYTGRFEDGIRMYEKYFEVCRLLNCDKLVFHGDNQHNTARIGMKEYTRRIGRISRLAKQYGVALCHENVSYCRLGHPQPLQEYVGWMGEDAAFVLDTKQARRAGVPVGQMLEVMAGGLRHVHISDFNNEQDCIAPGNGQLDLEAFVLALKRGGYKGDLIIELYRDGFSTAEELARSMRYVQNLLDKAGIE